MKTLIALFFIQIGLLVFIICMNMNVVEDKASPECSCKTPPNYKIKLSFKDYTGKTRKLDYTVRWDAWGFGYHPHPSLIWEIKANGEYYYSLYKPVKVDVATGFASVPTIFYKVHSIDGSSIYLNKVSGFKSVKINEIPEESDDLEKIQKTLKKYRNYRKYVCPVHLDK